MSNAIHILRKSQESLQSEAMSVDAEIQKLETQLKQKTSQLVIVMKRIQEIKEAITKLEKPDNATSKNQKAKR
jgi:uncharacterized protein involved in exopolysaccharide biosynthesis